MLIEAGGDRISGRFADPRFVHLHSPLHNHSFISSREYLKCHLFPIGNSRLNGVSCSRYTYRQHDTPGFHYYSRSGTLCLPVGKSQFSTAQSLKSVNYDRYAHQGRRVNNCTNCQRARYLFPIGNNHQHVARISRCCRVESVFPIGNFQRRATDRCWALRCVHVLTSQKVWYRGYC